VICTVGHGARSAVELVSILQNAHIRTLVDVRAFPTSRRHPQFSRESLSGTLRAAGIAYEWQGEALGGYRKVSYQEHMKTAGFREAAAALAALGDGVCIMCAERNPADCHRLHIADWLVAHGQKVMHLLAPARAVEHAAHPQEELWRDV
jgi:uncharacterized protein (DUF488 family)